MPSFDLEAVRAFLLVADLRSFTRAAAAMDTTQSVISARVKKLEAQLGRRLLERTPRAVTLSAAGQVFLEPARGLLAASRAAGAAFTQARPPFAVGFSLHLFGPAMPSLMAHLQRHLPLVRLQIRIGTTRDLFRDLDGGRIAAAVTLPLEETRRGGEVIGQARFGWMAAPDFVLADRTSLPIAVQPSPCAVRAMAVGALDRAGIEWHEAFVGGGVATLAAAAASGMAVAALSSRAATAGLTDVTGMLALPALPEQDVSLYATASDATSREVLRLIRTFLTDRS